MVSWSQVVTCSGLIKGNRKAPNPWAYTVNRTLGASGKYVYLYGGAPYTMYTGQLVGSSFVPTWDRVAAVNNAYQTCLSKLNDKVRGQLDLSVSLAEGSQTWKMLNLTKRFADVLVDMRNSYRREVVRGITNALSKSQFRKKVRQWESGLVQRHPGLYRPVPPEKSKSIIGRVSKLAANGWLEYTYGLKPLASDIYNIADQLVRHTRNSMVIKASVKIPDKDRKNASATIMGWSGTVPVYYEGFSACTISCRFLPDWDKGLSQWLSLNPIGIAYELTPLSFVLDWVFDLGSYMRNLETAVMYDHSFQDGFVSELTQYTGNGEANGIFKSDSVNWYMVEGCKSSRYYSSFVRSILSSYPTPRAPMFYANLGSSRLLSAAALLRQLLK